MILVTGGSGFLGGFVIEGLCAQGYAVRILTRGMGDWQDRRTVELKDKGVDVHLGDYLEADDVEKALKGCEIVINLVGSASQHGHISYRKLHVEALETLLALAEDCAVQRFIHVSCLGASAHKSSPYFASKHQAEKCVRHSGSYWTVFRPSFLFAESFPYLERLEPVIKSLPFVPALGGGLNEIQPVWVADVAACIVQSIYKKATSGKSYNLVGPERFKLKDLLVLYSRAVTGADKPLLSVPSTVASQGSSLLGHLLPAVDLDLEIMEILMADATADPASMQMEFEVSMMRLESVWSCLVDSFKGK